MAIELEEYSQRTLEEKDKDNLFEFLNLDKYNHRYFSIESKSGKEFSIKAKNFVGTLQYKDTKINIYPKLYTDKIVVIESNDIDFKKLDAENLKIKKKALQNFLFMLNYSKDFGRLRLFDSNIHIEKADFFEVLIYIFSLKLYELLKVNPNRSYQNFDDESNFLKGSWRISEQLSKMPHIKHRFLINYDEFTDNNDLNRIFKFVAQRLLFLTHNQKCKHLLQNILLIYAEIDDIPFPADELLSRIKFNRMNKEYEPIFVLAKIFLKKLSTTSTTSRTENFTFMFDMNKLFEEFIAGFIKRENVLDGTRYTKIKTQIKSKYLMDEKVFRLKPDIALLTGKNLTCIIDTKYKLLDNDDQKKYGVSQSDAYQMFAYAMKYNCKRNILLYPEHLIKEIPKEPFQFYKNRFLEIRQIDICRDLSKEKDGVKEKLIEIINK